MESAKEWLLGDSLDTCDECGEQFAPSYTNGWCPYYDCGEYQKPSYRSEGSNDLHCPKCGNEIKPKYQICPYCGVKLSENSSDLSAEDLLSEGEIRLNINGQKLTLSPGDSVGKNIQIVLRSQGKSKQTCRHINAEHARLIKSQGTILLRNETKDPLSINGRDLKKGELRPISDGDTLRFSNAIDVKIEIV